MYQLRLDGRAQRDLDRLRGDLWRRIRDAILGLQDTPRPHGSVKLQGAGEAYRIRVGDYRVVYEVDDAKRVVTVRRLKHRSEVYKGS